MKGFTYIEILLYVAILVIILGFSLPVFQSLQDRNDLDIAANSLAQSYRRAELLSQAVDGDSTWGVKAQSGTLTIFKGATYATRDQNYDQKITVSPAIAISGSTETVFTKFTGLPSASSTLTLTAPNNETRVVTLNTKGIVNY